MTSYSFSYDFRQISDFEFTFKTAGLDAVFEHGQAEGAIGYQERRAGGPSHPDPFDVDPLPSFSSARMRPPPALQQKLS